MARHLPTVVWMFWREDKPFRLGRIRQGCVQTHNERVIEIALFEQHGWDVLRLHRDDARMLHKRLGQCLEETK